jgi:hypothetical protein
MGRGEYERSLAPESDDREASPRRRLDDPFARIRKLMSRQIGGRQLVLPLLMQAASRPTLQRTGGRSTGRIDDANPNPLACLADGKSEIAVVRHDLSILKAVCDHIDVAFVLDHMDLRQFTSARLSVSRIYEVDGMAGGSLGLRRLDRVPADVSKLVPPPTASPATFYVLYSGHFALFDAHCSTGRSPG